jgi:hypothetical protein
LLILALRLENTTKIFTLLQNQFLILTLTFLSITPFFALSTHFLYVIIIKISPDLCRLSAQKQLASGKFLTTIPPEAEMQIVVSEVFLTVILYFCTEYRVPIKRSSE